MDRPATGAAQSDSIASDNPQLELADYDIVAEAGKIFEGEKGEPDETITQPTLDDLETDEAGRLPESQRSITITREEMDAAMDMADNLGKLTEEQYIEKELSQEEYKVFIDTLISEDDHEHPTYGEWRAELEPQVIADAKKMKKKGGFR